VAVVKCTACGTKFRWSFADKGKWPDYCDNPQCTTFIGNTRADNDIVMPSLRSATTKHNDAFYRQMEKGSEHRVHLAAEASGVPASELSDLKITNLNDRRDAEVAAMPVNNSVTQMMAANPGVGGFQSDAGLAYSGFVRQGPEPNAGARMMTRLRGVHADISKGSAVSVLDPDGGRPKR
jgi:hypothetical protein